MAREMYKRRRYCRFSAEGIKEVDYKDVDLLKDFISENAKIIPARMTTPWLVAIRLISEPRTTISFLKPGLSTASHFRGITAPSWALAAPATPAINTASSSAARHRYI